MNSELLMHDHRSTDMTRGSILRHIVGFSVPLMFGNFFQQLYNTVDSLIVGNYVGKEALAAIGATNMFINTLVGFFMGFSTGGGILISQYFGATNMKGLKKSVHTMLISTFFLGILFSALGILSNMFLLRLNATPDDVIQDAHIYLTIHFQGIMFLMLYNMGAGILRAVGDSRRPVMFLVVSSLVNVSLDFVFVVGLKKGISGAAYATIISQAVSAILVLRVLFTGEECYRVRFSELRMDFKILKKIMTYGVPGGIQASLTSFSNIFVQGYINRFGSDCMAGWAVFNKIDQVCVLPVQSLQMCATTFVGQNYGAGNNRRARKGVRISILLALLVALTMMTVMQIFSASLVQFFNRENGVIYYGSYFLRVCSLFYLLRVFTPVVAGTLRGFGQTAATMLILLNGYVFFRQIYLFVATHITDSFFPVSICYPVGWSVCSIGLILYYLWFVRKLK